jgi:NAD(P)-dependent dehydrogenase (short-subunit alcohol dehydrogenase family)
LKKINKIIITGYTSKIALELIGILKNQVETFEIIKCGRDKSSDIIVDFNSIKETKIFVKKIKLINPDYLFLNHGVLPGDKTSNLTNNQINESFNVNLLSFILILESIINIENLNTIVMSSISGKAGSYDTLYAATKSGIDVTIKRLAKIIPNSSRLNAVSPGIIEDAKMTTVREDLHVLNEKKKQTPTNRFTKSIEVAKLIFYIFFKLDNIQGENININGGIYID